MSANHPIALPVAVIRSFVWPFCEEAARSRPHVQPSDFSGLCSQRLRIVRSCRPGDRLFGAQCPTGIPHGRTVGETALGPLWMGKVIGWLDLESFERQIELAYVPSRHHAENRRGCLLSRAAGRLYSRAERAAYRRSRLHRGADILPPHTIGATPEDTARGLPIFCR